MHTTKYIHAYTCIHIVCFQHSVFKLYDGEPVHSVLFVYMVICWIQNIFAEVSNILLRLVEEFEQAVSAMLDGSAQRTEKDPSSDQDDMQNIQSLMLRLVHATEKLISANKTPVLVLDGLDKISTINQIRKVRSGFMWSLFLDLIINWFMCSEKVISPKV